MTMISRHLLLCTALTLLLGPAAAGATVDRVAAVVDQQVITVSEVGQMVTIRFFPRNASTSDDDYRHDVLESLIAQALRFRDLERFGTQDVPKDSIEARLREIAARFASPDAFDAAVRSAELTPDEVRALIKRQLQVEAWVQERFALTVSNEEIESYYRGPWTEQRRARGLAVPPLADVREEIRSLVKAARLQEQLDVWTKQLRANANVDIFAWR